MRNIKTICAAMAIFFCITSVTAHAAGTSLEQRLLSRITLLDTAYFTVRPDLRKCVSPICGGWYVERVNRKYTRCPDGTRKRECYVGTDKINIPKLSDNQLLELRQAMNESRVLLQGSLSNAVDYGLLVVSNAWISATKQTPQGTFIKVTDSGIRCITDPCPMYDAQKLNFRFSKSLAGYDLGAVTATGDQVSMANEAVNSEEGLLIAGRFTEITGPGGSAQGIVATQFYLKLEGDTSSFCRPSGCSGQICSDTDVVSTCEWRPEYACYRTARCSVQSSGDCGWEMDDELRRCLLNNSTFDIFIKQGVQ